MRVVEEGETPPPNPAASAAMALILKALQVLSQRTIIALASLFDLALCGTVFFLAYGVSADPKILQLWAVGGYAVFVLLVLYSRRK